MTKKIISLFAIATIALTTQSYSKTINYTIKKGDALSSIAVKYHTSVKSIQKLNGLKNSNIRIGKVLKITTKSTKRLAKSSKLKSSISKKEFLKHKKAYLLSKKRYFEYKQKYLSQQRKAKSTKKSFFASSKKNKTNSTKKVDKLIHIAKTKLGRKYVWGAIGKRNTFDCSGLTQYVYNKCGVNIPRTSIEQSKYGQKISRNNLKAGDLIFFDTSKKRKGYVNHVGIYIGNNQFLHASSAKKKVVITNLEKFYSNRFKGARRPV